MLKIAVDAMGGDFAPGEIVKGAISGAREYRAAIIFVGQADAIKSELQKYDTSKLDIDIIHTEEYLVEGESPAFAIRNKSNSSIMLCVKLIKEGKADAVISAGPTGGLVSSAVHILGTFDGITRPVIGGHFMGFAPDTVLFDIGSNIDSRPEQLLDFAMLGTVYADTIMGIPNPSVALVSIGSEEGKGNNVVREAYRLLKNSGLNFIGNVEGNDIVNGKANVVICDGFVGNILLKLSEGLGFKTTAWLKDKLSNRYSEDEILQLTAELRNCMRSGAQSGVILYGINGVVCKAHGNSKAHDISNVVAMSQNAVEIDLVDKLKNGFAALKSEVK